MALPTFISAKFHHFNGIVQPLTDEFVPVAQLQTILKAAMFRGTEGSEIEEATILAVSNHPISFALIQRTIFPVFSPVAQCFLLVSLLFFYPLLSSFLSLVPSFPHFLHFLCPSLQTSMLTLLSLPHSRSVHSLLVWPVCFLLVWLSKGHVQPRFKKWEQDAVICMWKVLRHVSESM